MPRVRPDDAPGGGPTPGLSREGFALPLAMFALVVLALIAGLLLDGAVEELRIARGDVALAGAEAAAESRLAELLTAPADSDFLLLARGTARQSVSARAADTVRLTVQSLGGGLARVITSARSWTGGVRADATTMVVLRVVADTSLLPHPLRYHRLAGWWWTQIP